MHKQNMEKCKSNIHIRIPDSHSPNGIDPLSIGSMVSNMNDSPQLSKQKSIDITSSYNTNRTRDTNSWGHQNFNPPTRQIKLLQNLRKETAASAQYLKNRIQLLNLQEEKARNTIESARKKAVKIDQYKLEKERDVFKSLAALIEKEQFYEKAKEKLEVNKKSFAKGRGTLRQQLFDQKQKEAEEVRKARIMHKTTISEARLNMQQHNKKRREEATEKQREVNKNIETYKKQRFEEFKAAHELKLSMEEKKVEDERKVLRKLQMNHDLMVNRVRTAQHEHVIIAQHLLDAFLKPVVTRNKFIERPKLSRNKSREGALTQMIKKQKRIIHPYLGILPKNGKSRSNANGINSKSFG